VDHTSTTPPLEQ